MKTRSACCTATLIMFACAWTLAQDISPDRLRELRQKARNATLTAEEKTELDAAMQARTSGRTPTATPKPTGGTPAPSASRQPATATPSATPARDATNKEQRMAQYAERQEVSLERMRQLGKEALAAAAARRAPDGPARTFYVNNDTGDDHANGLSAQKDGPNAPVRTIGHAISLLKPGDTLHLAVTSQPYRETMHLGDDFGGVPGQSIVIEGHGATLTGSDPLRLGGWVEAGAPGLYKSAKLLSELEEFGDEAKLMRVFFVFDGVMQHMGRSSKGAKARYKAPAALQPGEWTYVDSEKTFYVKVNGQLADAKIEVPYRRNGVAVRAPKVALTNVIIKDLIVCHVLNDGYNVHGTTQNFLLQNIAAYECGDDGISPHETCEVTIDGFWSVGNSTGMANGYLSVTKASNIHLEGNLGHQFMTAHAPTTELQNAVIIAAPGTQPINITNAQDTSLKMDNVQISAPATQMVMNVVHSAIDARRITVAGPGWENAGTIHVTESVIAGTRVTDLAGGLWAGERNVYAITFGPEAQNTNCATKPFGPDVMRAPGQPFPAAGANPAEFKIPPRPVPHPMAGKFTSLQSLPGLAAGADVQANADLQRQKASTTPAKTPEQPAAN